MKCSNCNKDNSASAKFCRYCGSPLEQLGFKSCVNGHNYDASLTKCPFCPTTDYEKTVRELDQEKTVLDNSQPVIKKSFPTDDAKTVIDTSAPTIKHTNPHNDGKTVLIAPYKQPSIQVVKKLVGWLVTFDLNPNGVDFRLFEGRNEIGRSNKNDIVINHPSVSDKHCTILYRNDKFLISDELSTNGTYLNNEIVEDKAYLNDNDIIKLGNISLKLRII
jgi:hypothetical protein